MPELLNLYEKISKFNLYIPNTTINQYILLLDRFALIQQLEYIELKLDTSSQLCNENSEDGAKSIFELI